MLNKLDSDSSNSKIGLQNKSWVCMVAFSIRIINHIRKGISVYTAIDNNYGVQKTLTGKDTTTYDTNMTNFQPISKDFFWTLFENLTIPPSFNVFEIYVKKTLYSITIFRFCRLFSASNWFTKTLLIFEPKSGEVWWLRITLPFFSLFRTTYWFSDLVLRRFHSNWNKFRKWIKKCTI